MMSMAFAIGIINFLKNLRRRLIKSKIEYNWNQAEFVRSISFYKSQFKRL